MVKRGSIVAKLASLTNYFEEINPWTIRRRNFWWLRRGFDFSSVAVSSCQARTPSSGCLYDVSGFVVLRFKCIGNEVCWRWTFSSKWNLSFSALHEEKPNFCIKVVKNSDEEKQKASEHFKANVCGTFRKGRRDSAGNAVEIATYARSSGINSVPKPINAMCQFEWITLWIMDDCDQLTALPPIVYRTVPCAHTCMDECVDEET